MWGGVKVMAGKEFFSIPPTLEEPLLPNQKPPGGGHSQWASQPLHHSHALQKAKLKSVRDHLHFRVYSVLLPDILSTLSQQLILGPKIVNFLLWSAWGRIIPTVQNKVIAKSSYYNLDINCGVKLLALKSMPLYVNVNFFMQDLKG